MPPKYYHKTITLGLALPYHNKIYPCVLHCAAITPSPPSVLLAFSPPVSALLTINTSFKAPPTPFYPSKPPLAKPQPSLSILSSSVKLCLLRGGYLTWRGETTWATVTSQSAITAFLCIFAIFCTNFARPLGLKYLSGITIPVSLFFPINIHAKANAKSTQDVGKLC